MDTNKSADIGELAKALASAQGKIKPAMKDSENPFFKSRYADLATVMAVCRDELSRNGIAVVQLTDFSSGQAENLPDTTWIVTTLLHSSGQWISGRYPVRPIKQDPQSLGSAVTYARRYGLMAMVGIVAADDDDGEGAMGRDAPPPQRPQSPPKPTQEEAKKAAVKFAQDAMEALSKMQTEKELTDWRKAQTLAKVDKLKDYDRVLFEDVMSELNDATARVLGK